MHRKGKGYVAGWLRQDYVIKDNKPDVSKVVCQNGQVKIDEIKASGENIWISGSIEFEVLYTREEVLKAMSRMKISAETEWSI